MSQVRNACATFILVQHAVLVTVSTAFTIPIVPVAQAILRERTCQLTDVSHPTCLAARARLHRRLSNDSSISLQNGDEGNDDTSPAHTELNLLTFDLDDTIFPIGPVVQDANDAMVNMIHRLGYTSATNDEIIAASKQIRAELREAGDAVTYTNLRKQSVRREIERMTGWHSERVLHDSVVDIIFDAWLSERHASADRNLYPSTTHALESIRKQHPNAVIGAITNGRGNPLDMPSLVSYFDFCVSGEDDDVFPKRKPDKGIYEAALRRFFDLKEEPMPVDVTSSFNWIHVGDDLANDVGASASCGAKAIWFTADSEESSELPSWSTATAQEMKKRAKLDEKARGFVSAKISALDELPRAISTILCTR